jgi:glycosyltransferase involved in cell wall biosynthesis
MSNKVRVLTLIAGLAIGDPLGGAERFGAELASHLDQEIFTPIVCAFWQRERESEKYWSEYLTQRGVEFFFAADWPGRFSPIKFIEGLKKINLHLQDVPIAIIHSHFQVGSLAALILKRKLRVKALLRTAHLSPDKEWGNGGIATICRLVFTKLIFPLGFDLEVGVSQAAVFALNRRFFARLLNRRALWIPNAISLSRFKPVRHQHIRQELGIAPDELVVGSVGRLTEQKGYIYLIEAASKVISILPNVKFLIIGEGPLRRYLQEYADALRISNSFIFIGPREDLVPLYSAMDLFVLPSLWEGLPTVIFESMACGVPVIATNIPGTRELVRHGHTGWLVEPKDSKALAEAIIYALQHPDARDTIARTAAESVVPLYSMEHIANQYQAIYLHLLNK